MTNSCNLQCSMCNGDWSSSIRAHREHRPPLPVVYDERFFEELAQFLPHLDKANFLGGEPFLGSEPLRVLGMLADLDAPPAVAVTTNGTQWSQRIERICERLPISFVLSLDGVTKDTYESIRIGADFDEVMQNLDRFQEHAERHGTLLTLAHCFMRPNWHEFSRFLHFAEQRGVQVGMNEVLFPAELSLFQLPAPELRQVVAAMEEDDRSGVAAGLGPLRHVWEGQLDALRHRLELLDDGEHDFVRPWADHGTEQPESWDEHAVRVLTEWTGTWRPARVSLDGTGSTGQLVDQRPHVLDRFDLTGATTGEQVVQTLAEHFGGPDAVTRRYTDMLDDVVIADPDGDGLELRVCWNAGQGGTSVLVAYRNSGPIDIDDARAGLGESDRTVVLTCDRAGAILTANGPIGLLVQGTEPVEGLTLADLQGRVLKRFGGQIVTEPGPSGYANDTLLRINDDRGVARRALRVFSQTTAEQTLVLVEISAEAASAPLESDPSDSL